MAKLIIIHASEIPGGPDKDGRPQIIDAQCIWKNLPHTKEFLEEFKKFSDEEPKVYPKREEPFQTSPKLSPSLEPSLAVPPKTIDRDPLVCEKLTPLPILLPIRELLPVLAKSLVDPQASIFTRPSDEKITIDASGLLQSNYIYPEDEKKKIIEELPKLDLGLCKWGCKNLHPEHAILFSISNLVKAFQESQNLKHPKIIKVRLFTDSALYKHGDIDEVLSSALFDLADYTLQSNNDLDRTLYNKYVEENRFTEAKQHLLTVLHTAELKANYDSYPLSIPKEDVLYFVNKILPYITIETVDSSKIPADRIHIDGYLDFD